MLERAGVRCPCDHARGESTSGLFGADLNWRGPIWMPLNDRMIDALRRFHSHRGPEFRVERPVGSGQMLDLAGIADELAARLAGLFVSGAQLRRRLQTPRTAAA